MKMAEKVMIGSCVAMLAIAGYFILGYQVSQIERQHAANPEVVATCQRIADKAHGPFSQNKEIAVMEECLTNRDPAYAAARFDDMCRQAKTAGAKPEAFTDDFRKRCFGNG